MNDEKQYRMKTRIDETKRKMMNEDERFSYLIRLWAENAAD